MAAAEPARQEFPGFQVSDLTGQTLGVKELFGKATVLNFWATWCGPCRTELPALQSLLNEFGGKGLVVLAVDVDVQVPPEEDWVGQQLQLAKPRIDAFLQKSNVTLPVYVVDGKTQAELNLERIPLTVLLDGKGGVVRIYSGYSPAYSKDLREQVLGILAGRSQQGGK